MTDLVACTFRWKNYPKDSPQIQTCGLIGLFHEDAHLKYTGKPPHPHIEDDRPALDFADLPGTIEPFREDFDRMAAQR